jgi:acyl-CoA synthetase (AMP-forming)/AMP-acid ligase II
VPASAPRGRRGDPRLASIIADARPAAVLTTADVAAKVSAATEGALASLPWIATDALPASPDAAFPDVDPNGIALLQYTSGSISTPKGVVITHHALLANTRQIRTVMGVPEDRSVWVSWLPLFHDMGLAAGIMQPVFSGGHCVLFSPTSFAQRPARWLETISRYRATHSGGPNSAYALCARRAMPEGLDLSTWKLAFCGGEPVAASTLDRFAATFAPNGFDQRALSPCYGLAEATLLVTGGQPATGFSRFVVNGAALMANRVERVAAGAAGARELVGNGGMFDQEVAVVNPGTHCRCGTDEVGEIWVAGPNVGQGYWRRPDESRETFGATVAGEDRPYLRTGDMGFVRDGFLYVTGRLKDLIIVRGRNYYANDIEACADGCHDSLIPGGAAAFPSEHGEQESLVLVHEVETPMADNGAAVIAAVRRAVFVEHGLPVGVVLVRRGVVPRTTSGKVQRRRCRQLLQTSELPMIAGSLS